MRRRGNVNVNGRPYDMAPRLELSLRALQIRHRFQDIAPNHHRHGCFQQLNALIRLMENKVRTEVNDILLPLYQGYLNSIYEAAERLIDELFPPPPPAPQPEQE